MENYEESLKTNKQNQIKPPSASKLVQQYYIV